MTPHCLRHTFASLHIARGTNLLWIQEAGGWASAKMLLDVYGHFMPTESAGFADAITAPNDPPAAPPRHQLLGRVGALPVGALQTPGLEREKWSRRADSNR